MYKSEGILNATYVVNVVVNIILLQKNIITVSIVGYLCQLDRLSTTSNLLKYNVVRKDYEIQSILSTCCNNINHLTNTYY